MKSCSGTGDWLRMRLQNAGTASSTQYYIAQPYVDTNGAGTWVVDNETNVGGWRIGFPPASATLADTVTADIMGPFLATQTTLAGSMVQDARYMRALIGSHRVSTSYSGLSFLSGLNGATMVCNVRVYGYKT